MRHPHSPPRDPLYNLDFLEFIAEQTDVGDSASQARPSSSPGGHRTSCLLQSCHRRAKGLLHRKPEPWYFRSCNCTSKSDVTANVTPTANRTAVSFILGCWSAVATSVTSAYGSSSTLEHLHLGLTLDHFAFATK